MISFLKGTIDEIEVDSIVVDVNGVGYDVYITSTMLAKLPQKTSEIKLYTHHHIREDAQTLYGFLTKKDRETFKTLLSVSGVGPKVALGVLSVLDANSLVSAVVSNDVKALSSCPGIGKKTAARLILELKDKFGSLVDDDTVTMPVGLNSPDLKNNVIKDAKNALVSLGYSLREVNSVFSKITPEQLNQSADVEEIIKLFLKNVS